MKEITEFKKKGIKYFFANYVNIHGSCMGKIMPIEKLSSLESEDIRFAGVTADGIGQKPNEIEVSVQGDISSGLIMPWNKEILWIPCYLRRYNDFHPQCSRVILKKIVDIAKLKYGITFNIGIEAELYLLKKDGNNTISPLLDSEPAIPAYNLRGTLSTDTFWKKIVEYMEDLHFDVFSFMHEGGKSQFEFSFGYKDPITIADRYTFFRIMAKEIANQNGSLASFMPKPFSDDLGSSAQINISINFEDRNLETENFLKFFTGGIIEHARSIVAVACPTVNSYKRLIGQGNSPDITWAPTLITYGQDNRTAMLRLVSKDNRIEYRPSDSSCNPYLTIAMLLAAGLDGIDKKSDPGGSISENLYEFSEQRIQELKIKKIPTTLIDAINEFKNDFLSEKVFGSSLRDDYVKIKMQEWFEFYYQITDWELKTYLDW